MTEPIKARVVSEYTPKVPPMPRYVVMDCWFYDDGNAGEWNTTAHDTLEEAKADMADSASIMSCIAALVVEIAEGGE